MNKLSKLAICMALALNGAIFAPSSFAATTSTTITISATVIDSCTVSAAPLSFGNYNGISGGMLDTVAMISPTCTVGTVYAISLCPGQGNEATHANRRLTGPDGAALQYSVYTDASRTSVWGDGTGGSSWRTGSGTGSTQSLMMYGRVPAAQSVTAGSYSDTITVTLTY
jgi:spore coat protein U-like protein